MKDKIWLFILGIRLEYDLVLLSPTESFAY